MKGGETHDFAVSLLLLCFARPKFGAGGVLGSGRTVFPLFSEDEISAIIDELRKRAEIMPLKRPKEILQEIEMEKQAEEE